MENIIVNSIKNNFTNIINGKSIDDIQVTLSEKIEHNYLYDIIIIYNDNNNNKMIFNDKLSIMKDNNKILYRNLYKKYSLDPIINYTSLSDLGKEIFEFLLISQS
jgi:hypothetical protein